ncbi:MAG: hypothetical protein Q7R40_15615 [Phaeospirillum sp.]|nr:hypothetical protein [Phaeospirillum sp.]
MSDYFFYAAMLRFVANKTEAADPGAHAMMAELRAVADAASAGPRVTVAADRLELAARAFAGFAAFLQKQILPEAVALGNAGAEAQLRWAVDVAMAGVNTLLGRAALVEERCAVELILPPPP